MHKMHLLNCIIIEDEPLGSYILQLFTDTSGFTKLIHKFDSLENARTDLDSLKDLLVLLDINFKAQRIARSDIAKILAQGHYIILVTAYPYQL